jgi:hypothetical protein
MDEQTAIGYARKLATHAGVKLDFDAENAWVSWLASVMSGGAREPEWAEFVEREGVGALALISAEGVRLLTGGSDPPTQLNTQYFGPLIGGDLHRALAIQRRHRRICALTRLLASAVNDRT